MCVCVGGCMSVYALSGVTHGGEAELHSLVFASESNEGRLNPVPLPPPSAVLGGGLCIFVKTTKNNLFFPSLFSLNVVCIFSSPHRRGGAPPVFSLLRSVLLQLLGGKILLQVALVARQWEAVCDPGQEGHRPAVLLQLSGLLLHVNLVAAGERGGGVSRL